MRYMTCAAAIMLLAFATTGCQTIGTTDCAGCGNSGMMSARPGCGCSSGCKGGLQDGFASSSRGNSGACSCGKSGCRGGSGGYGQNGINGYGSPYAGGSNGNGGSGCRNGSCRVAGGNGAGSGSGGFAMGDLRGCMQCMSLGRPCGACLAPGGRLCGVVGGGLRGAAARFFAHNCQTPHTIPYAQTGMGGPGPGGPTPHYGYPYYTTRAPRDFLSANPPSIGP